MANRPDSVGFSILRRMRRGSRTHVWTPRDFVDIGTRTAVNVALHRLETKDAIRRISWGLYDLPRFERDELAPPDYAAVLAAVERRDGVKVLVDEQSAAQQLGLAPNAPSALWVLTSRHIKDIALGNRTIRFRTVAPRRLVWAGRPAAYVVQAMKHLRNELDTSSTLTSKLREILDDKSGDAIRRDLDRGLGDLPIWLLPHVKKLLRRPGVLDRVSP
jgi:Family of unknown function (DUF6088)